MSSYNYSRIIKSIFQDVCFIFPFIHRAIYLKYFLLNSCRGVIICSLYGRCRLAFADTLLTVPPKPSHGPFPWEVAKKVPFCIDYKVSFVVAQIDKVFIILIMWCSTIGKIYQLFDIQINRIFQHFYKISLEKMDSYCVMFQTIRYDKKINMLQLCAPSDKWMQCSLIIIQKINMHFKAEGVGLKQFFHLLTTYSLIVMCYNLVWMCDPLPIWNIRESSI